MQSVSDDDVRKRLIEKPRFELAAKGVFRLGRCYIFWQGSICSSQKLTSIFFPVAIETSGVMNQLVLDLLSEIGDASAL